MDNKIGIWSDVQLIGDKDRRSSIKEVLISDPGPVKRVFHEYKKIPIRKVFEAVLSSVISITTLSMIPTCHYTQVTRMTRCHLIDCLRIWKLISIHQELAHFSQYV